VKPALWLVLAVVLGGGTGGAIIALRAPGVLLPVPSPPVADLRPPEASFNPVFEPCAHCHQIGQGARMMAGPSLQGVIGRKAGTMPGYPFSPAMKSSGLTWDEATLDRFVTSPQAVVPGTRMVFAGMDDPVRRKTLIVFIVGSKNPP
jgi:cytochrome c